MNAHIHVPRFAFGFMTAAKGVCVCVCVCLTEQFCCIAEIKHSIVNQLYFNNLKKIAEDLSQPPEATSEEGKSLSL